MIFLITKKHSISKINIPILPDIKDVLIKNIFNVSLFSIKVSIKEKFIKTIIKQEYIIVRTTLCLVIIFKSIVKNRKAKRKPKSRY